MAFFSSVFQWLASFFFSKNAEISIVGLQASGKTSFVNVLVQGQWVEDTVPTVAFNLRRVRKGNVTMRVWDVAGQPKFRSMWERYCKGNDAIVFVVDSTDRDKFDSARFELHSLLSSSQLAGVPLLVLGNKCDLVHLKPASVEELIVALWVVLPALVLHRDPRPCDQRATTITNNADELIGLDRQLDKIQGRTVSCYSCSMKEQHNFDIIIRWLTERGH